MKMHPNMDAAKVRNIIIKITNERLRNIPSKLHNNITKEWIDTDMLSTFDWIENRKPIITGNGTFFKQHEEYLAPEVTFIDALGDRRGKLKKEMLALEKGTSEYDNKNTGQGNVKVAMNAEYGGSGTTASPFFNLYIPPATTGTAKNLTTTLICCLEFLSGNDHKYAKLNNINELMDMINIVLNDTKERDLIKDYSYTPEEVCKYLVSRCNNINMDDYTQLLRYLSVLSPEELCKLMLCNNIHLVIKKYVPNEMSRVSDYLINHQLDLENMTVESIQAAGYGVKAPAEINEDILHISKVVCDNCVYPFLINDAEVRSNYMDRLIVCVTDTDSLMVHFPHYIDTFNCDTGNFKDSCLVASAFGMRLFIEHIIPDFVEYWAINAGIESEKYRKRFIFKNEFAFLAMALVAKKMYAASMFVQEGAARNIHEIAVTGLSFKKRDAAEFLEQIMDKIYDKYILTSGKIDVEGIYNEYCMIRNTIVSNIHTSTEFFKVLSYQDPEAYDQTRVLPDQIRGSLVWNRIIEEEPIIPPDRIKVVNLSFDLLEKYKDDDYKIKRILEISLEGNENKKYDPVICLPEHYKQVPDWISKCIDVDYTVDKLLSPFKQLMSLFNFYLADTRGGVKPSRMLCI